MRPLVHAHQRVDNAAVHIVWTSVCSGFTFHILAHHQTLCILGMCRVFSHPVPSTSGVVTTCLAHTVQSMKVHMKFFNRCPIRNGAHFNCRACEARPTSDDEVPCSVSRTCTCPNPTNARPTYPTRSSQTLWVRISFCIGLPTFKPAQT